MKIFSLLLLVTASGLIAAEETKPVATTKDVTPAATPATPAETLKSSKVPGVSDEDYYRYIKAVQDIEKNNPNVKALKDASDAAKIKIKDAASPAERETAVKESRLAEKAYTDGRREAVLKKYPEFSEIAKKVLEFWTKEGAKKKAPKNSQNSETKMEDTSAASISK